MSVKSAEHVQRYVQQASEIQAALAHLHRWASNLPIPTSGMELPSLHYGHLGTISEIHGRIGDLSRMAAEMYMRNDSR